MGGGVYASVNLDLGVYFDMAFARGPVLAVIDATTVRLLGKTPLPHAGLPFWHNDHVWIAGWGIASVAVERANPQSISRYNEPDWHLYSILSLESGEDLVIGGDGGEDYRVFSIADPAHPKHLDGLVVQKKGIDTYVITNPSDPADTRNTGVFKVDRRGRSSDKVVVGEWIVQVQPQELIAINSSGAVDSILQGNPGEDYFSGLIVEGGIGFLTGFNVVSLDFSDPLSPTELDRVKSPFDQWSIDDPGVLHGGLLCVGDEPDCFHVFNVTAPTNMMRIGGNSSFRDFHDLALSGDRLVVAGGYEGLIILDTFKMLRLISGGNGSEVHWDMGTLQLAPRVNGPWTDLPAASPFSLSPIGEVGFFRVKVED